MENTPSARLKRAHESLEGLSVGDAFGEGFFGRILMAARDETPSFMTWEPAAVNEHVARLIKARYLPPSRWKWTDDTALALEIVANLRDFGRIEPNALGKAFSNRYLQDPQRGYGGAMHSLLPQLRFGDWKAQSESLFGGTGSFGNGAAMRVAPLGAYFADDLEECVRQAALSAIVTHAHPEGVAGAIAVAVAAALAAQARETGAEINLIAETLPFVPESEVRFRLNRAINMKNEAVGDVAQALGSGYEVSAQDTVPFCLWCAAKSLGNYEEALWETVSGLGDRDTTCAIVGGIVAACVGAEGIPVEWKAAREDLGSF